MAKIVNQDSGIVNQDGTLISNSGIKIMAEVPYILAEGGLIRHNSGVNCQNFRARQVAEVLEILKRPALLENEVYEGDSNL